MTPVRPVDKIVTTDGFAAAAARTTASDWVRVIVWYVVVCAAGAGEAAATVLGAMVSTSHRLQLALVADTQGFNLEHIFLGLGSVPYPPSK